MEQPTAPQSTAAPSTQFADARAPMVLRYLAQGIAPQQVAQISGVDVYTITAMLDDTAFQVELRKARAAVLGKNLSKAALVDDVEDKVLKNLARRAGSLTSLKEMKTALEMVDITRKGLNNLTNASPTDAAPLVQITLPAGVMARLTTNRKGVVIAIDDAPLFTLQPKDLATLADAQAPTIAGESALISVIDDPLGE